MKKRDYYSALDKTDTAIKYPEVDRFNYKNSTAFVWNIELMGIPVEYTTVDLVYIEPAWLAGYAKFMQQANALETSYQNYLKSVSSIVTQLNKPTVIISGKSMRKYLPPTEAYNHIKLLGGNAIVNFYNILNYKDLKYVDNIDLLEELSKQYDRVGDFCCGYGNTGKIFDKAGKSFVMSDINPRCIGYIKNYYENL